MMKIGIIGLGMVGKAIYDGLALNTNNIMSFYDVKFPDSKIEDIFDTDIVYISVPTLPDENNKCNLTILNSVISNLTELRVYVKNEIFFNFASLLNLFFGLTIPR